MMMNASLYERWLVERSEAEGYVIISGLTLPVVGDNDFICCHTPNHTGPHLVYHKYPFSSSYLNYFIFSYDQNYGTFVSDN